MSTKEYVPDNIQGLLLVECDGQCAGYKQEFLTQNMTSLEKRLLFCSICGGLTKEAVILDGKTSCNICCKNNQLSQPNDEIRCSVLELQVSCPLKGRECGWIGTMRDVARHTSECEHLKITCSSGCNSVLFQNQMVHHQIKECPMREVTCEKCGEKGTFRDMDQHLNSCIAYQVQCPEGCGLKIRRDQINEHIDNTCCYTEVYCPYQKFGCQASSMARKDLEMHQLEENITHQQNICSELGQLREAMDSLKRKNTKLEIDQKNQNEIQEMLKREISEFRETIEMQQGIIIAQSNKIVNLETVIIRYNFHEKYNAKLNKFGKLEMSDLKALPKCNWVLDVVSLKPGCIQEGNFSQFGHKLMCRATIILGFFYNHLEISLGKVAETNETIQHELPLSYFSIQIVNRRDERESLIRNEATNISIKSNSYSLITEFPISTVNSPDFKLNNKIIVRIQLLPSSDAGGIDIEETLCNVNLDSVL